MENRVALVPASVAYLVGNNHRIIVVPVLGAGLSSHFQDIEYSEAVPRLLLPQKKYLNVMLF